MSWANLISGDAYISVNKHLARLFGLNSAVYLAEMLNITKKVLKKQAFDPESGLFKLDRKYIELETTLSAEEQYACDLLLEKAGIVQISPEDRDKLTVDCAYLASLIVSEDTAQIGKVVKKARTTKTDKAASKKAGILISMKRLAADSDPELDTLYAAWVESVYAAKRFLTKEVINIFRSTLKDTAQADKEKESELLKIAITNGWSDPTWVVNSYSRNTKQGRGSFAATKIAVPQAICNDIDEAVAF